MALADPQSVTIGTAVSMPRTITDRQSAQYAASDGSSSLVISHLTPRGRRRSLVKVTRKKITTDPLTDVKSEISASINITLDRPAAGFTEAELLELCTGSFGWGSASTNANFKKVIGMES